jgi:hypothetical protein
MQLTNTPRRSKLRERLRIAEELQGPCPIWGRLTGAGRLTGFSRTRLFELKALSELGRNKIRFKHVKAEGKSKGYILVNIPSLLEFIEEMEG